MSNSEMLDDLRYCADNFVTYRPAVVSDLREFAASLIGAGISPPAQKPASVSGDSGAGLVGNPRTIQTFESWVETLGDLYRVGADGVHRAECSQNVFQMLLARDLLDEYRAFAAVCQS